MSRPALADMVVVGAGVIGSSIAFRLAEAGVSVTIVEAKYAGSGTSGHTFSWLNSFDKPPLAYHQLNVRSIGEHRVLAEEIGSGDCLHLDGGMVWEAAAGSADNGGDESHSSNGKTEGGYVDTTTLLLRGRLASQVASCRTMGYQIEEIDPMEAMALEPDLLIDRDNVHVVFRMPMEGWIEATGLAHRLCTVAIRRHGARLLEGVRVAEVSKANGQVNGVKLSDGSSIAADLVINAAGPEAGKFASSAGAMLPIQRSLGVNFVTSSVASQLRHVVHAPGTTLRPDSATRVMLRGANIDSTLVEDQVFGVDDPRCRDVLSGGASVMPRLKHATIESVRVGIRPIPGDGLSAVGPDPDIPGLYHAVTHSGATLSAILGRLVCADLLGGKPPELEPFRPARFKKTSAGRVSYADSEGER